MKYYAEMTVEEAMKKCGKNAKVLVAIQNLEEENTDVIFENIKTVASLYDDFIKQLNLFTEKQDIYNIKPKGMQKIILLKE